MYATYSRRKLQNEDLTDLYSSPNNIQVIKSRRMRGMEYVARMRKRRGAYKVLVVKPTGRRVLGRPRSRWQWLGIQYLHLPDNHI
jgi:hypothetical protein